MLGALFVGYRLGPDFSLHPGFPTHADSGRGQAGYGH